MSNQMQYGEQPSPQYTSGQQGWIPDNMPTPQNPNSQGFGQGAMAQGASAAGASAWQNPWSNLGQKFGKVAGKAAGNLPPWMQNIGSGMGDYLQGNQGWVPDFLQGGGTQYPEQINQGTMGAAAQGTMGMIPDWLKTNPGGRLGVPGAMGQTPTQQRQPQDLHTVGWDQGGFVSQEPNSGFGNFRQGNREYGPNLGLKKRMPHFGE